MDHLKNELNTNMQFKQGARVITSDNQDAGTIDRVILDPRTDEVIGLVVRKGWLFTEDKIVSIGMIAQATEDQVKLRQTETALESLPEFEETYYVPVPEYGYEESGAHQPEAYASALYDYPPVGTAWWGYGAFIGYPPVDPRPNYAERVQQNIPEGTIAVREGARILSIDGDHVGDVEDIFADPATNRATHIVISRGLLFKERKLIPTDWIKTTGEDEIMLTVHTLVVNELPNYDG